MAAMSETTRNTAPAEGGPSGGRLEAKVGAFYLLCLLTETEPRGLAGSVATRVKFQRGYEGHALDDIIVEAVNAAGETVTLEIQAKRTLDFTASDEPFGKVVAQIVSATDDAAQRPIAAAIARTNTKIDRHYQQLLILARKVGSSEAMRRALDAPRVVSAGMRDFTEAFRAQLQTAGADASDETLWRVLRRFQILVFDFESPGAVSSLLALSLARLALPPTARDRADDLWSALQEKALSFDADGGDLDRSELIRWLREERGFEIAPSRNIVVARQRLADHSQAALDAIEDRIAGVTLDRSARVDELAATLDGSRYVEIVGAPGVGKSSILKALALQVQPEAFPLVLSPARIPGGGWLTLSRDAGFEGSAPEFLLELAASGATILFIDSLDRIADPSAQETVKDLLLAAVRTPDMRVVATVGPDFDVEQRAWLPGAALDLMGRGSVTVGALSDDEAHALAQADARLGQLLANSDAQPLTRNLYQLRQLLQRSSAGPLPLTEGALAQSWWESGSALARVRQRDRVRSLRALGAQVLAQAAQLDIASIDTAVVEDLLQAGDLDELVSGATAAFKHDVLRDWSTANLLREDAARISQLPLHELAPVGLARSVELYARMLIEGDATGVAWSGLVGQMRAEGVHSSWLRQVLLALVRSEQGVSALDRAFDALTANRGELLQDLIRHTIAADSEPVADRLQAAGLPRDLIPDGLRMATGLSWARLMVWLLGRIDELDVPVGRDILHFFSVWLPTNGTLESIKCAIVQQLYDWLCVLEDRAGATNPAPNFSQLFAFDGRGGRGSGLGREVRGQFLIFCDQSPDLAAAYLTANTAGKQRYDIVGEVLKLSQATAKAAPHALAAFTIDALIEAEKRYRKEGHGRRRGRLEYHSGVFLRPGPATGPFLGILRADAAEGLRLVRRFVDYGLELDGADRARLSVFILDLAEGPFRVIAPGTYWVSRNSGGSSVVTSALRALEAWGHEQVDAGRAVADVVKDILGEGEAPGAIVAVAVDVLLSHATAPDPLLIPFTTSPELLHLDWERFNQDRAGIGDLEGADPPGLPGAASNATLRAHGSRQTALSWALSGFLLYAEEETLEGSRETLRRARARLAQADPEPEAASRGPLWQADHALRILDRANWRRVRVERPDGEIVTAYEYVEPPEEAALLEPLRSQSNDGLAETLLISALAEAVVDAARRSDDLLERGMVWAKAQAWSDLAEDEEDFDRSQRWRAVVAAATLSALSGTRPDDRPWTRSVLGRALEVDVPGRAYHVRFHALALAAIGWAALATEGDEEARTVLLDLAGRDASTVIMALGDTMDSLAIADARLPKALLRVGLVAAIQAERAWDDEGVTAERQTSRDRRLAASTAEETAWLDGGPEPPWPDLPQERRFKKRRGLRVPGSAEPVAEEEEPTPAAKPEMWFNDHSGGAWLAAIEQSRGIRDSAWIADLVAAYRDFSDIAWGLGLPQDAESSILPTRWLHPFDRLRLRTAKDLGAAEFEAAVLAPLVGFPDQSFLDCADELVNAFDSLFWDEKRLTLDRLVEGRARIVARVMACRHWRYGRDECVDTISMDLAGPIQALFLHVRTLSGPGRCYLPLDGEAFAAVFPALLDLTRDAPGRGYVASHFLSLVERAQAWVSLDVVLSAAEAWVEARANDAGFWRDQGYGRRLCALIGGQIGRVQDGGSDLVTRARRLAERLISAGVPEALPFEHQLAAL